MIVLDTSVLSLAFRRSARASSNEPAAVTEFRRLIALGEDLAVPGIVWQELLSGTKGSAASRSLRRAMVGFPVVLADRLDHEAAATIANHCQSAGVAAAAIDCLIAAQTIRRKARLFTADADFDRIARVVDLRFVERPSLG